MDGERPEELPEFLSMRGESKVLEADDGREVSLMRVFEHYEVRSLDAAEAAKLIGIGESDVRKGISYWRSRPEVYDEMESRVENFSAEDVVQNAANYVKDNETQDYTVRSQDSSAEASENPVEAAEKAFSEIIERPGTALTSEDIRHDPDENYLAVNMDEVHLEWERNDTEVAVYAGWSQDIGPETGVASFSVDGDQGKTLYVDRDQMEDMVQEMYRNAVFGVK